MIIRCRIGESLLLLFAFPFLHLYRGWYSMKAVPATTQSADERHVFEDSEITLYGMFEDIYVRLFVSFDRTRIFTRKHTKIYFFNYSLLLVCERKCSLYNI